jgi:hypothetical protein
VPPGLYHHSWPDSLVFIHVYTYIRYIHKDSWASVAHACNPSYSGGRDQEDHGLKPAWANSLQDPISKTPSYTHKKRSGGVAQDVGPALKLKYHKNKRI